MAYDDYDGYGDESEDYQDIEDTSSGFQIGDGGDILRSSGSSSTDEASLEELLMQGELLAKEDQDIGIPTESTLLKGRVGHLDFVTQDAIKDALHGRLDASKIGLSDVNVAGAVERLTAITGSSPEDFAGSINGSVSISNNIEAVKDSRGRIKYDTYPSGEESGAYRVYPDGSKKSISTNYDSKTLRTAVSVLGSTAVEYLERGPGSTLPGNYFDEEKKGNREAALANAYGAISHIADKYLPEATKKSSIYGLRKRQVEEALTKRFMDGNFYKGSKALLPLPNELGVLGLVPTMSEWRGESSPFNRLSFGAVEGDIPVNEQGKYRPSVKDSLFKRDYVSKKLDSAKYKAAKEKQFRDQQFRIDGLYSIAEAASGILREAFPTMSNESYGSERYMTKSRNEDDWGDRSAAMDEAAYFDLERTNIDAVSSRDNPRDLSEQERFISGESLSDILEEVEPEDYIKTYAEGAHGDYQRFLDNNPQPEQRSPEWFKKRKGLVTGSKVADILKKNGIDKMSVSMAVERLSTVKKPLKDPYSNLGKYGNAYTEMGKEGEAAAERSFLAGPGRGLKIEKTFLETNKNLEGFGATPDGRLFNPDGTSAGLLELKYLGDSTFEEALEKYTPQAQLQMAVGEEEKTHLYVLNRETGESMHHEIVADKQMQQQIIEKGRKAIGQSEGLNLTGIEELMSKIKLNSRSKRSTQKTSGKEARFVERNVEADEPMSAFDTFSGAVKDSEEINRYGKLGLSGEEKTKIDERILKEQVREEKKQDRIDRKMDSIADKYSKEAYESIARGAKESEEALRNFSNTVGKASSALLELAGVAIAGNKSAMDEVRLSRESGLSEDKLRGMREVLEDSGMNPTGINSVLGSAVNRMQQFNNPISGAKEYTRQLVAMGASNIPEVSNTIIPEMGAQELMDPQQQIAMVKRMISGKSLEASSFIANVYGMPELTASRATSEQILNARDSSIDVDGAYGFHKGVTDVEQSVRYGKEYLGTTGEGLGTLSAGGIVAGGIAGSATAAVLGKGAYNLLKARGPAAANAVKSLSSVGKANPLVAAASLAPMAVRHLTGVKDDGSFADSAMDVLEFASAGAAIGSMVPVVGTAVGGVVGAGIGLVNEFFEEDQLPSSSIGGISTPTSTSSKDRIVNNITVTNEISPELVVTRTNINGDLDEDAEVLQ